MKNKIFATYCIILFLLITIPTYNPQKIVNDTAVSDTMPLAHVVIKGNGTAFLIGSHFIAGIGRSLVMIVNLGDNGQVEINKLFDISNPTVLSGSHVVILIGFIGYYYHIAGITINGVALIAIW